LLLSLSLATTQGAGPRPEPKIEQARDSEEACDAQRGLIRLTNRDPDPAARRAQEHPESEAGRPGSTLERSVPEVAAPPKVKDLAN
jgi:hypothetical protein